VDPYDIAPGELITSEDISTIDVIARAALPRAGGEVYGPIYGTGDDPVRLNELVDKHYVDQNTVNSFNGRTGDVVLEEGDVSEVLVLPIATTTILGAIKPDGVSVSVTPTGVLSMNPAIQIPDAPIDVHTYGRKDAAWHQVIAASGDVVDGGNF
jgi:hypothetical protein